MRSCWLRAFGGSTSSGLRRRVSFSRDPPIYLLCLGVHSSYYISTSGGQSRRSTARIGCMVACVPTRARPLGPQPKAHISHCQIRAAGLEHGLSTILRMTGPVHGTGCPVAISVAGNGVRSRLSCWSQHFGFKETSGRSSSARIPQTKCNQKTSSERPLWLPQAASAPLLLTQHLYPARAPPRH